MKDVKKFLKDNDIEVHDTYPTGAVPDECVILKYKGIKPKNNVVTTHRYDVQIFSRVGVEEFTLKVYMLLLKDILKLNGYGYPQLEPVEDSMKEYKTKNLKSIEYRYSVDVIDRS
ncbi:MAG: hypothetical protein RR582_06800 [Niameybacter sp.]